MELVDHDVVYGLTIKERNFPAPFYTSDDNVNWLISNRLERSIFIKTVIGKNMMNRGFILMWGNPLTFEY